jgi:hypothetical protein
LFEFVEIAGLKYHLFSRMFLRYDFTLCRSRRLSLFTISLRLTNALEEKTFSQAFYTSAPRLSKNLGIEPTQTKPNPQFNNMTLLIHGSFHHNLPRFWKTRRPRDAAQHRHIGIISHSGYSHDIVAWSNTRIGKLCVNAFCNLRC